MGNGVRRRDIGRYQFSLIDGPEGDHYVWRVNRVDLGPGTADRFGEVLVDGTARDEEEGWERAGSWLDDSLSPSQRSVGQAEVVGIIAVPRRRTDKGLYGAYALLARVQGAAIGASDEGQESMRA